jgi:hypothetical protein
MRRFFIHYNKQASRKAGRNVLTLHWKNACHMINHFASEGINLESHENKRQPRCVFRGFAKHVFFHNDSVRGRIATISA